MSETTQDRFDNFVGRALGIALAEADRKPTLPNGHIRITHTYALVPRDVLIDGGTHSPYGIVTEANRRQFSYRKPDGSRVTKDVDPRYNAIKRLTRKGEGA